MAEPTPSQWAAVSATADHVLVAAGAGTGKTTTVIDRILYLLGVEVAGQHVAAPVQLREIAAITYTNAAATDLKRKLRVALRKAGRRAEAAEVDVARIGTIHGFCADLLREFALRAGRPTLRRVVEDAEATGLKAEGARQALIAASVRDPEAMSPLYAQWSAPEIEGWLVTLLADADRLQLFRREAGDLPAEERAVLELAAEARSHVDASLEAAGAADFDGLIVWTRDLLRDHPPVRRALQRRLRLLVVDEFQDTDPVQREIAYLIGEPERRSPETTRLLLVGDPKQSIYRFRRADVSVWREVERDFRERGLGRVVTLEDNFRSVAPLLGFVDAVIGPIMDRPVDAAPQPFEVPFHPVKPTPRSGPADHAVELLFAPPDPAGGKDLAQSRREREARLLAARLAELHRGPEQVPLGEMAVLLASWTDVDIYEAALRAEGLRTYSLRGEGFYESREVMDLVLALEVLLDPRDDRALFGFLRSPWAGLSDESLVRIARQAAAPRFDALGACVLPAPEEAARLRAAVGLLEAMRPLRDRLPIAELLERLLDRTGYLAHLALRGEAGLQPIANVHKFLRLARDAGDHGVTGFLRLISDLTEAGVREGEARLFDAHEDVVTITTIHSAKGLEWRVVAWADLARAPNEREASLLLGRRRIALKRPDAGKDGQPDHYKAASAEILREAQAERKRLWYVAATRAKERLLLSGFEALDGGKGKTPAEILLGQLPGLAGDDGAEFEYASHLGTTFRGRVRLAVSPPPAPPGAVTPTTAIGSGPAIMAVTPGRRRQSATAFRQLERCGRRHYFKYVAGMREPERGAGGIGGEGAIARGQIVHEVLEQLREDEELSALLEDAIRHWDPEAPGLETAAGSRYRERLAEEVRLVRDAPPYRDLIQAAGHRRELRFLHLADEHFFVEGAIDLATPRADGITLLDVKTTQCAPAEADRHAAAYAIQRAAYVRAVEAISPLPVRAFVFQFSRAQAASTRLIDAAARAEGEERITGLMGQIRAGRAPLAADPSECVACGFRREGLCPGTTAAPAPSPPPSG